MHFVEKIQRVRLRRHSARTQMLPAMPSPSEAPKASWGTPKCVGHTLQRYLRKLY